jgi:DnaJ-class molecular chaperone
MVCERCQGEGWLHRMVDGHKVYGRPFETSCSRVCPSCSGKGHIDTPAQGVLALEETK